MTDITTFTAMALQIEAVAVNSCADRAESSELMMRRLKEIRGNIASTKGFTKIFNGTDVKLVVLPEYFLTSFPLGESFEKWSALAALEMDGPEYEAIGKMAQDFDTYIAGNVYENDPNFPGMYFQTCFVAGTNGDIILRYRRLISLHAPTPYDVWDKYLDIYGADAVFPVADTDIGKIGCIASEEILYPEIARCLAMKGAEILCHPTSEVGAPGLTPKETCRRARAIENMAFVVASNTSKITGTPIPEDSTGGMSKIVDYKGNILAEAYPGNTFCANAILDMDSLRKYRQLTGMANLLSRQPFGIYAPEYTGHTFAKPNTFIENGEVTVPDRAFFNTRQQETIDRLTKDGVL